MAITDNSEMVMPVTPINNGGFGGNNGFGGDWAWIILLLLAFGGGWGNGFGGGYAGGNELYPWMNQAEITTGGFQNAQLGNQITAVQSDLGDIQTQLCNGFAGVNATVNGGFANAETAANARQMANMQQAFASQTAMTQGLNDISSQFANCCCENRLGIADLKYTVATENCADRQALNEGVRDIIASQTAGTQRILDQMCADKIDAKNDTIAQLRQELLYSRGQASQTAQTATLLAPSKTVTYKVKYQTLIDDCPQLKNELDEIINGKGKAEREAEEKAKKENREATAEEIKQARAKDKKTIPQRVNKKLKDVFTAAFRIIAEKSDAPARYLDFTLPTTTRTVKEKKSKAYDIPTKSTLSRYMVITHRGRNPQYTE